MTPSIYFIVLVLVLGTLALGWSFYRRQQFKPAIEPGRSSRSVSLPGKHVSALRVRLGCALVALSLSGLTLLLGPTPSAWAAVSHPLGNKGSTLTVNQVLHGDDYLMSPNGQYVAYMQDDGNFVLYHVSSSGSFTNPYWATGTGGHPNGAYFAIMQADGNFCTYKGTGPSDNQGYVWCTRNTALPTGQYFAIMQDDGNFVVYHGSGPSNNQGLVWATNTVAGVGAHLSIVSGNNQTLPRVMDSNGILTAMFAPLSVALTDNIGNPLSGKQITWSVTNNPNAIDVQMLPFGNPPATSTTDANGIATLDQMAGNSVYAYYGKGPFNIVASSGSASVTFNETVSS